MWWTNHLDGGPRRVNHASVAIGDYVYSFGGYCSGPDYDSRKNMDVFILDTRTLRWRNLFDNKKKSNNIFLKNKYKTEMIRRNMITIDEKDDEDDDEYISINDENEHVYSSIMRDTKLLTVKESPCQRYGHTVVAYNGKIYLWGGRNDQYGSTSSLHEFTPVTKTWKTITLSEDSTIPPARDGHSAIIYNNSMYVFGGFEYFTAAYSNEIFEYNFNDNKWTRIMTTGELPSPRDFHAACLLNNKMYIFGGRGDDLINSVESDSDTYCDKLYSLDLNTKIWKCIDAKGDLPSGRRSHTMWTYKNKIYLFGGYESNNNRHFNDLYSFNPEMNEWKRLFPEGVFPCPRRRHCSCVVGDKVFIFGGTAPNKSKIKRNQNLLDLADTHVLDYSVSLKTLTMRKITELKPNYRKLPYMGYMTTELLNSSMPNNISLDLNKCK